MTELDALISRFDRYSRHIEQTVRPAATAPFVMSSETSAAVQVERGMVFPIVLVAENRDADVASLDGLLTSHVDRLIEWSTSPRLAHLGVVGNVKDVLPALTRKAGELTGR